MMEFLKDLDIFSESVQFNSSRQRLRKRTILGAFLTMSIILSTGAYFFYQFYLYLNGQMDPKFRQQTFVQQEVNIKLNNEMFGFDFFSLYSEYSYLNQIQADKNKTYIVFVPAFTFTNSTDSFTIPLDVIKCQSPELQGMNCLDVSKIPNQLLSLKNADKLFTLITIFVYRCQDIDQYKTFIPDNCADEYTINQFVNNSTYRLNIKIQTSQFNTTSQEMQISYRNQLFQNSMSIVSGYEFKMQSQVTKVNQGILIQSQKEYSSLISYQLATQTFDRQSIIKDSGCQYFSQIFIDADESVAFTNIQYPLFTEILALCNSTLALLLILGSFCRKIAQNLIRRDIMFILFRNFFTGTYFNILKHTKIVSFEDNQQEEKLQIQNHKNNSDEECETKHNILPPSLTPQSSQKVFRLVINSQDQQHYDYIKEDNQIEIKQSIDKKTEKKRNIHSDLNCLSPKILQIQNEQNQDFSQIKNNFNSFRKDLKIEDFETQQTQEIQNEQNLTQSISRKHSFKQTLIPPLKDSNKMIINRSSIIPNNRANKHVHLNHTVVQMQDSKSISQAINYQTDKRLLRLNDNTLLNKLEKLLFPLKLCKGKKYLESKGLKKEMLNQMEQYIDDSLDFFKFYQDILFFKKAIMILLNEEQLAALQIIGMDIEPPDFEQKSTFFNTQKI